MFTLILAIKLSIPEDHNTANKTSSEFNRVVVMNIYGYSIDEVLVSLIPRNIMSAVKWKARPP